MGRVDGNRRHRRHREGRHLPADADRSRPAGARLVQGPRGSARLPRHHRRHGRDVRPPRRHAPTCRRSPSAAISTPSRPAASSTVCSACWPRSRRCARCVEAGYETYAPIEVVNWTNEEGSRFAPGHGRLRRVRAGVRARLGARAHRPRWRELWRGARRHRLSRRRTLRRASAVGVLRTAYRAGADPGGRRHAISAWSPACRRCAGTRSRITGQDAHTGTTPMPLAQERTAWRGAADRAGRRHRRSHAPRRRHRRPDREPAELAQCHSRRGVLLHRPAASGRSRARLRWRRPFTRRCRRGLSSRSASPSTMQQNLGPAGGAVRSRLRFRGAAGGGALRLFGPRHGLRRRPRRGLRVAGRAHRDDFRALPRRHQPQRGRVQLARSNARPAPRCCCRRCWSSTAGSPSETGRRGLEDKANGRRHESCREGGETEQRARPTTGQH